MAQLNLSKLLNAAEGHRATFIDMIAFNGQQPYRNAEGIADMVIADKACVQDWCSPETSVQMGIGLNLDEKAEWNLFFEWKAEIRNQMLDTLNYGIYGHGVYGRSVNLWRLLKLCFQNLFQPRKDVTP